MGKYRDAALAAYAAREQAQADAEQAQRGALVARARAKAAPLWTQDGKPLIDPEKGMRVELVDEDNGLVVLSVLDNKDAVEVSFGVYPDADKPTKIARFVDGAWQGLHGPEVADLDDVGAELAEPTSVRRKVI